MEISQKNFLYAISKIRQNLFTFLEEEMEKSNVHDISPSDGDILFTLDQNGPQTVQEIANSVMKDKSTVSSVITKLEKNGYISKEHDSSDGRFVQIKLTAKAKKIKPVLANISDSMNSRIFNGLSDEEKKILFNLMEKIYKNV